MQDIVRSLWLLQMEASRGRLAKAKSALDKALAHAQKVADDIQRSFNLAKARAAADLAAAEAKYNKLKESINQDKKDSAFASGELSVLHLCVVSSCGWFAVDNMYYRSPTCSPCSRPTAACSLHGIDALLKAQEVQGCCT